MKVQTLLGNWAFNFTKFFPASFHLESAFYHGRVRIKVSVRVVAMVRVYSLMRVKAMIAAMKN